MRRATTVERTMTRRHILRLPCPECTHRVAVGRDELLEGATVHCRQCGSEAVLARSREPGGREQWLLLDPLADFDDPEDERRA